ncbi:MAG: matrixin family metalloprotease [Myxococcales bacterium]|nr:matrixin family metalloprotease [Myxococcales bacterium]
MKFQYAFLLTLLGASAASAYSVSLVEAGGAIVRWNKTTVTYRLHSAGSADIVDDSDLGDVRAGWQQWNDVACSALNFVEGAPTTNKNTMAVGGPTNGSNEVTWAEGSEWVYGQWVLGVTNTSFSVPDGIISEADITFNGYQNTWSTTGKPNTVDVLNVAAHEQGHFFGAQHVLSGYSSANPPTMAPTADPDLKSQTLEDDDERVACFLYPQTEYTCTTNADCPYVVDTNQFGEEVYTGVLACKSGFCGGLSSQLPKGEQTLGEDCASDYDCVDGMFCQQTGLGDSLCAKECSTSAQCGSGFQCIEYSNADGGVCLPDEGGSSDGSDGSTNPGKAPGEACLSSQECDTYFCVGSAGSPTGTCRTPCDPGAPSCGSGEECVPLQTTSFGACLPAEGNGAALGPGSPCDSPSECLSGLCAGDLQGNYLCRDVCDLGLGNCPEEFACFALVGGGGACFPAEPTGGLGATCEFSDDCDSGICIGVDGIPPPFCTIACSGSCGCGFECADFTSGENYCIPGDKVACVPSGNACSGASECVSKTCIEGICRDPCQVAKGDCPSGQACLRATPGGTFGTCETAGASGIGVPCTQDGECVTNLCELGACQLPCDIATSFCGAGLACKLLSGAAVPVCAVDDTTDGQDGVDGPDGAADGPTDGASDGVSDAGDGASDGADGTDSADGVSDGTSDAASDGGDGSDGTPKTGGKGTSGCVAAAGERSVSLGGLVALVLLGLCRVARARVRGMTREDGEP